MSDDQIRELYKRTDDHGRLITDLTIEQRTQAAMISNLDNRFDRFLKDQERTRSEILEAIRGHQKREGVKEFFKDWSPWVAVFIAVAALVWKMQGGA